MFSNPYDNNNNMKKNNNNTNNNTVLNDYLYTSPVN